MQNINGRPVVSVITPSYNSERFIGEAIDSVLSQSFQEWEMIIVDDGSVDATVEIIEKYQQKDKRIHLIRLQKNSGPAIARNTAIQNAQGRYLAFLDSDDVWLPQKLEEQLRFMQNGNIAFSFTEYVNMDENGEEGSIVTAPNHADYNQLLKENVIGCLTVMIDKELVGKVEMVNIRTRQDYVLWLDLVKRGYIAYGLKLVLAKYINVENSVSSNKIKMAKQNWRVYREIEQLSLAKSSWYFIHYMYFKLRKYLA